LRSFDPVRVGELECDAWVAYYMRRWGPFLRASPLSAEKRAELICSYTGLRSAVGS
jgi:hypothetical protein